MAGESGLADPGLALDHEHAARPVAEASETGFDHRPLAIAVDEVGCRRGGGRSRLAGADELTRRDRSDPALDELRRERAELGALLEAAGERLVDEDLAGAGALHETRGEVHRAGAAP